MKDMNNARRPLSDEEKLVLEYIRLNPTENQEDIINYFCGWDYSEQRSVIAGAIGYLVHNFYVDENPRTKQLTVRIGE